MIKNMSRSGRKNTNIITKASSTEMDNAWVILVLNRQDQVGRVELLLDETYTFILKKPVLIPRSKRKHIKGLAWMQEEKMNVNGKRVSYNARAPVASGSSSTFVKDFKRANGKDIVEDMRRYIEQFRR